MFYQDVLPNQAECEDAFAGPLNMPEMIQRVMDNN